MTREEAVKMLKLLEYAEESPMYDALNMAIEALQERPKGRWIDAYPEIEKNPMFMYGICSECGCKQSISNKLNFCFDCGAEMEVRKND